MPTLADLEETQPVDDGDDGDRDSHLSDETLKIETESAMDDSILYGDTQPVDDDGGDDDDDYDGDGGGGGRNDDGIKTQVVDDVEDEGGIRVLEDGVDSDVSTDDETEVRGLNDGIETQVIDDDDCEDDSEGIDVAEARVSKVVDSDASTDNDDVGSSEGNETQVVGDDDCETDDEGIDIVEAIVSKDGVLSAASTDDDASSSSRGDFVSSELPPSGGSSKSNNESVRSIAAIRTASIRSSGLAAAKRSASKAVNKELKPSCNGSENCHHQVNDTSEIDRNHEARNSQKNTQDYNRDESKSRTRNPVVKKLSYEQDSPCSHVPANTGGLSYVGSQEPGAMSQANALDVVDKFLVVNYLGLSQEADTEKSTDMVKSPPVSNAKGAQILVKKTDYRSPVGKTGIFEWIDSLEDDGGGEFFTKRRDSFFKRKDGVQKSRSHPPKSRHTSFGLGDKGDNIAYHQKITNFRRSDSRLVRSSSLVTDKVRVAETRTKKNLFGDLNEQSNSKYLGPQLEVTDVGRGDGGTCEVGPDTQMAAEAMEALVYGSPINNEINDAHPAAGKGSRSSSYSRRVLSRNPTSSSPNLNDVSAGSKQRKMLPTKSKRGRPVSSGGNSRGKRSLECTTEKAISKSDGVKLETNINASSSVNHNECSAFFKGDKTLTKEAGECPNSLTLGVQFSVSKELVQGELHVNSTPVAHRTRRSKAVSLSKMAVTGYEKDTDVTVNVKTHGTRARGDKLVAGTSGSLKKERNCSYIVSVQNAKSERETMDRTQAPDIDGPHVEVVKAGSVENSLPQSKRRRTRRIAPDNPNINEDLNHQSVSKDGIHPTNGKRKIRCTVKSISEILDVAIRKKRLVSTHTASEIDDLNPDGGKAMPVSNTRTRSSLKSPSLKPNMENALKNGISRTVTRTPCSTSPFELSGNCKCQVEVSEAANIEESPKQKLQTSGLPSTTPSKDVDAMSPVVVAQYHPRTSGDNGRSRLSIARELIRLEASSSSPASIFITRRRKDMSNIRVLFSHHLADDIVKQQKKIMVRLGIPLASSILDATHFITDNFVRTRNMLEAMASGKPVVTHMWLESCGQASCFIDEKNYFLRDSKKEREIGFSMPISLARACQNPLLQGKRVYITPNTKPSREVVSSLVKAAQGQPLERLGRSATKDDKIPNELLVLSCEEDYATCIPLLEKGAKIFNSELILNGIVIQKLEFERHRLFSDHVKRTRSTLWLRREDGNEFLPVIKCT